MTHPATALVERGYPAGPLMVQPSRYRTAKGLPSHPPLTSTGCKACGVSWPIRSSTVTPSPSHSLMGRDIFPGCSQASCNLGAPSFCTSSVSSPFSGLVQLTIRRVPFCPLSSRLPCSSCVTIGNAAGNTRLCHISCMGTCTPCTHGYDPGI